MLGDFGRLAFQIARIFFSSSFVGRFEIRLLLVNPVRHSISLSGGSGGGAGGTIGRESLESLTIQ